MPLSGNTWDNFCCGETRREARILSSGGVVGSATCCWWNIPFPISFTKGILSVETSCYLFLMEGIALLILKWYIS